MTSGDDTVDAPTETISLPSAPGESLPPRGPAVSERQPMRRVTRARDALRAALASYRLRIVAWFVALLTLGTLATIFVVGQLLFQRIDDGIRADLVNEVNEFRALATGNDPATGEPFGSDVRRMFDVFVERNIAGPHEVVVTFVDGQPYRRSAGPSVYPLEQDATYVAAVGAAPDTVADRMSSPLGAVDYVAVPVRFEGQPLGIFSVAIFREQVFAEQDEIVLGALAVGMVVLVIGSLLAWRLADRLLAPVAETAATARSISETDLSQRVDVTGYDEVADLARTFNEMLDRLQSAFAGQRRFLDDVGHELRTPLTIVRGHLELFEETDADERENTRLLVLDEIDRMARLVDELVMLAQADRPDFLRRTDVAAGVLVGQVREKVAVLGDRRWEISVMRDGSVNCDPQRMTQALLQLAANAVRHTVDGGRIELGVDVDAAEARFWVTDDGPGVPLDEQARLFERFYRGRGQPRSGGTGLGLSIVQAIAQAHGGRAIVENGPRGGARFTITIPVAGGTVPAAGNTVPAA